MEFNQDQISVIKNMKDNILLEASAGTGKTNTISYRINNILENNKCLSSEILCITFTNKACHELQDRISKIVKANSKGIVIKTFHSFCIQIIKENIKKGTDIFSDFTVADENDSLEIIKNFNNKGFDLSSLYRFINICKEYRMTQNIFSGSDIDDYTEIIKSLFEHQNDKMKDICKEKSAYGEYKVNIDLFLALKNYGIVLLRKYNQELRKSHLLDFSDLIIEAYKLLKDKSLIPYYKNKFKFINIDEIQDTSRIEFLILERFFSKDTKILLAGDINQTIYSWRGSDPKFIEEEFKKYDYITINLKKNYRSSKLLVSAASGYLTNTFGNLKNYNFNNLSENEVLNEKITYKRLNSRKEEALWINNKISSLLNDNSMNICILTRDNKLNIELSKYLKDMCNSKYEYILVDQFKFFRREEIKDITSIFKILINTNDISSIKRVVKKFRTGVGDASINEILSDKYRANGISLGDFFIDTKNEDIFDDLLSDYKNNKPMVVFDVESTGVDVTTDEIVQIAAIKIDNTGNVIDTFVRFIKPDKSVGDSYFVHGFSDEELKEKGEDKLTVFRDFIDFSNDCLIIGHNVNYDISILSSEFERLNLSRPKFRGVFDTLDLYRRFYFDRTKIKGFINYKLETLSKIFETTHKPTHNALDDVYATADILIDIIKNKIIDTSDNRKNYFKKYYNKFSLIRDKIQKLKGKSKKIKSYELVDIIISEFNLQDFYDINTRNSKMNNIYKFKKVLECFYDDNKSILDNLISSVNMTSLSNGEIESMMLNDSDIKRIPIITVHQSKGLEFNTVFIAGLEDGRFPSFRSKEYKQAEEEKRLFYVAITRAKEKLFLSNIDFNNYYGNYIRESPFIEKIPSQYINKI